jgi:DNA-binding NtrC family response regulator
MIVDDEPDVLYTYISFLKGTHYNVKAFLKPDEALAHFAAAKQPSYDFVILDIRMPEINGLQLYQRLKAISPETRIIFITSLDAAAELTSVLKDVKPFEVIRKPLSRDKFLRVIEAQLLRHKASKNRH